MKLNNLVSCVEQRITSIEGIDKVVIAYSGGVDSHVLLHICAQLQTKLNNLSFKAVYIDHDLQEDSSSWSSHCKSVAADLGISFVSQLVNANDENGDGPEQAARIARYSELSQFIDERSVLLTAQHQDDQAETFILQLLRGAGVDGLASMPLLNSFEKGFISRPLLNVSKKDIVEYANKASLNWVEDSSNLDESYDRNFLRQQVIPLIQSRWPAFSKTTTRSAAHCAEASSILTDIGDSFLMPMKADEFHFEAVVEQEESMQRLAIRQWLKAQGVRLPTEKILLQIHKLLMLDTEQSALVEWSGCQIRLFNARLFLTQKHNDSIAENISWGEETLSLPGSLGVLSVQASRGKGIDSQLWDSSDVLVRSRQGGEAIKLAGRSGSKKLKKLLNEEKIFPWVREFIPLIYCNEKLVAVANLWVDEKFIASDNKLGYTVNWDHPDIRIK